MSNKSKKASTGVKKRGVLETLWRYRVLELMCLPAIVFFFMFSYMPMPGIWVAFVKYNYRKGIFGSKFVGLQNFEFLAESGKLFSLTRNTVLYNLAFIILGNLVAVSADVTGNVVAEVALRTTIAHIEFKTFVLYLAGIDPLGTAFTHDTDTRHEHQDVLGLLVVPLERSVE